MSDERAGATRPPTGTIPATQVPLAFGPALNGFGTDADADANANHAAAVSATMAAVRANGIMALAAIAIAGREVRRVLYGSYDGFTVSRTVQKAKNARNRFCANAMHTTNLRHTPPTRRLSLRSQVSATRDGGRHYAATCLRGGGGSCPDPRMLGGAGHVALSPAGGLRPHHGLPRRPLPPQRLVQPALRVPMGGHADARRRRRRRRRRPVHVPVQLPARVRAGRVAQRDGGGGAAKPGRVRGRRPRWRSVLTACCCWLPAGCGCSCCSCCS